MTTPEAVTSFPANDRPKPILARLLSPFSARQRGELLSLRVDPRLRIAMKYMVLASSGRLLYVRNSKAGCTTIVQHLNILSNGKPASDHIHTGSTLPQGLSNFEVLHAALQDPNVFKFTFVRHPIDRCLSAFHDFFIDRTNPRHRRHLANFHSIGMKPDGEYEHNLHLFLDYVQADLDRSPLYSDRHWRTQAVNIGLGHVKYHLIGKLEEYEAEIIRVLERFGFDPDLVRSIVVRRENRSSASRAGRPQLTRATMRRVASIYETDMHSFGYQI